MESGESTTSSTEVNNVPKVVSKEKVEVFPLIQDLSIDRIGRQSEIPQYFNDVPECPIDLTEDVLRHCGGRLTIHDARLLYSASMHLKAKTILEVGSFDG